jgi:hypothetical protein
MLRHFAPPDTTYASELNDYAWRQVARHYHEPTGELAGPHSRAYADINSPPVRSFVYAGTDGEYGCENGDDLEFPGAAPLNLSLVTATLDCPEKYRSLFDTPVESRWVRDHIPAQYPGTSPATYFGDQPSTLHHRPLDARTYLSESYALGSFTRSSLWYQRRPLQCYWREDGSTRYCRVRGLLDGEDFRRALLTTSQYRNHAVSGFTILTDDPHASTSAESSSTIDGDRLELCFEVGGPADSVAIEHDEDRVTIQTDSVTIDVSLLHAAFGRQDVSTTAGTFEDTGNRYCSVVLCEDRGAIDLESLEAAAVLFGVDVESTDRRSSEDRGIDYDWNRDGDVLQAAMASPECPGRITVPAGPCDDERYTHVVDVY